MKPAVRIFGNSFKRLIAFAPMTLENAHKTLASMKRSMTNFRKAPFRFMHDRSGNFAVLSAFAAVPLLLAAGIAIDYTQAISVKSQNQAALDAALLASANLGSQSAIRAKAENVYAANGGIGDITKLIVKNASSGVDVTAASNADSRNNFAGILGFEGIPITVESAVKVVPHLIELEIEPDYAQGTYSKDMILFARQVGQTTYSELGRISYRYDKATNTELPMTSTFNSKSPVKLTNVDSAYFEMQIDPNSLYIEAAPYLVLRTNDPTTSHHVFFDKVQLPKGSTLDLTELVPCGKKVMVDWEDGGNFSAQDFGFKVTGKCVVTEASPVRLTK